MNNTEISEISREGLKREYKLNLDQNEFQKIINQKLEEISSKTKMSGFRPGKIPTNIIKNKYYSEVKQEELPKFIQKKFNDYVSKEKIKIIGYTEMYDLIDNDQELSLKISLHEMPDIEEPDYGSIKLKRYIGNIEENLINDNLKLLSEKNRNFKIKEGKAESGDMVVINFLGKIENIAFEGGKGENFELILGSKMFIDNFEDQLLNSEAGDDILVKVKFPENYGKESLKGKEAEFEVHINSVKKADPSTLDDDLAIRIGFKSLDELTDKIKAELRQNLNQIANSYLKKELFDELENLYQIDLPENLVEQEFDLLWRDINNNDHHIHDENCDHSHDNSAEDSPENGEMKQYYRNIAKRRIKLAIILDKIGKAREIQLTPEELKKAAFAYAQQYPENAPKILKSLRENSAELEQLKSMIFEEKVVDFILDLVDISEEEISSNKLLELAKDLK